MPDLHRLGAALGVCVGLALCVPAAVTGEPVPDPQASPSQSTPAGVAPTHDLSFRAPVGVRRTQVLERREWRIGYLLDYEIFNGNRSGTNRETDDSIRNQGFSVVPYDMVIQDHRFELLYSPIDRVTVALELPVQHTIMRQRGPAGNSYSTRSLGIGDLALSARARFMRKMGEHLGQGWNLSIGFGFPTGSIKKSDDTPKGRRRLPYIMQPGTGSVSFLPGITYLGAWHALSWGAQFTYSFYTHHNNQSWRAGNELEATGWLSHTWLRWIDTSVRLAWLDRDDVHGKDTDLDPKLLPANDARRYGGSWLELGPGVRIVSPKRKGPSIGLEMSWPIYQSLSGPQLEKDWRVRAGCAWRF